MEYLIIVLYLFGYMLTAELSSVIDPKGFGTTNPIIWNILLFLLWWLFITLGLVQRIFRSI